MIVSHFYHIPFMKHNFTLLYTLNIKKSTDFHNILGVFGAGAKKHLMLSGPGQKNTNAFWDGVKKHQQGFRDFINRVKNYLMKIKMYIKSKIKIKIFFKRILIFKL